MSTKLTRPPKDEEHPISLRLQVGHVDHLDKMAAGHGMARTHYLIKLVEEDMERQAKTCFHCGQPKRN